MDFLKLLFIKTQISFSLDLAWLELQGHHISGNYVLGRLESHISASKKQSGITNDDFIQFLQVQIFILSKKSSPVDLLL